MISMDTIELFRRYLSDVRRFSGITVTAYTTDILDYYRRIGSQVSSDGLNRFVAELADMSPATIRRKVSAVRCYLSYTDSLKEGSTELAVVLPRLSMKLPKVLPLECIDAMRKVVNDRSLRDQIMVLLAYVNGLRVSEIAMIKVSDIDFHDQTIHITGKRGRTRKLPITDEISGLMSRYLRSREGDYSPFLFSRATNVAVSTRLVQTVIKQVMVDASVDTVFSAHSLRHSAATHLLESGATIRDVQSFLGHQRLSTTQIYTKVVSSYLRSAVSTGHSRY
jgi:integrase/recombinase XerD